MNSRNAYRLLALALVIAFSGCGEAPVLKPEAGELFIYDTGQTPYSTAICIARNARRSAESLEAEERLLGDSSTQVVVRSGAETLAVAEVHRQGVKSKVSIRVIRAPRSDRRSFAQLLMTNC